MAAGEASGDICSLLGLELVCVVPAGWPRIWLDGVDSVDYQREERGSGAGVEDGWEEEEGGLACN
jgi:hypothetical protein